MTIYLKFAILFKHSLYDNALKHSTNEVDSSLDLVWKETAQLSVRRTNWRKGGRSHSKKKLLRGLLTVGLHPE